ncbi:hypothetical protein D3C87_1665820 [compost metagenome]
MCARVDQHQFAGIEAAVGLGGHAVVDDGAIGAGAGNRVEAGIDAGRLLAAKGLERGDDADFGQRSLGRLFIEPAQELGESHAIEPVRLAHAGQFGGILDGLGAEHGVALLDEPGTGAA